MARVLIVHGSRGGRIAERLAEVLRDARHEVRLEGASPFPSIAGADAVLVVAEPHGGRRAAALARAMRAHATVLKYLPTAFLSVCTAPAGEEREPRTEAEQMLRAFLDRTGWQPELAATVAGRLDVPRPGPFRPFRGRGRERGLASTPDDASADCSSTDWDDVRRFAEAFSALITKGAPQHYRRTRMGLQRT